MELAPDLQLPSIPEVTLRALDACQRDESYRTISEIIAVDTALVARVLALANSAVYRLDAPIHSVEQALLRLGLRRFHTLLLTAALRQLLFELGGDQWQQLRDFWRHSLTTALTAKALATLTRYQEPDEAFMLGMLHNIGELIAIKSPTTDAQQYFLDHQGDVAAELVTSWGLGPLAADAMRYQQALPTELRDAGHLVKLISLATRLALSDAAGVAAAATVFGLNEELTREINRRIANEVTSMAASLGIPLEGDYQGDSATRQLRQTILNQAITSQALGLSDMRGPTHEILAETVTSLTLITGLPALCFGYTDDSLALLSSTAGDVPRFALSAQPGGSVLTEAFATGKPVTLGGRSPTVLDRQLLSLLRSPSLLAVPVSAGEDRPGVFVLGTDQNNAEAIGELTTLFTRQLSTHLLEHSSNARPDTSTTDNLQQELARLQLRQQIHEVSNPLTIIRQYIYQLRNRLEDAEVQQELDVIRDELDRASDLLLNMSRQDGAVEEAGTVELNTELKDLSRILEDSLFSEGHHTLTMLLCNSPTALAIDAAPLRQIIINLIRNAVESLPEQGGEVVVRSSAPVWQNHRTWVELEITDTGHGIPEHIRAALFAPVSTTKGKGHSGLGLSIVKQLIDDMEGIIACRTGQEGTTFRILLPAAGDHKTQTD